MLFLIHFTVLGQEKFTKDLDFDGIIDSVYVDTDESRIICMLSSQNFKEIKSKPIKILNEMSGIIDSKNGFFFLMIGCELDIKINSDTTRKQRKYN